MLFYIETSSSLVRNLFKETINELESAELYIESDSMENAIKKAQKYLDENNGSHLKLNKVMLLKGLLLP